MMGKLKSILKLKTVMMKHKLLLIVVLFGVIAVSLIGLPIPYLTGILVDDVLVGNKKMSTFCYFIVLIGILYIFKYFISAGTSYITGKWQTIMSNELKLDLIKKIINLPMSYINNVEKGYLQARLTESETITTLFSGTIISTLLSLVSAVAALSAMMIINYKLGAIVLFLTPVFFIITKMTDKGLTEKTRAMMESSAKMNTEGFEIINGIEDIKILNGKEDSLKNFKESLSSFVENTLKQNKAIILIRQNTLLVNDFGSLMILLFAGILIIRGNFTIGLYTTFSLYSAKIFSSAQLLSNVAPTLKQLCLSIERVYEIIDADDENKGKEISLEGEVGRIKLDKVTFAYRENTKLALENLSFEILKGEKVLIRGKNGSGKTTLIKLLLGLYEPTSGKIFYNNSSVTEIRSESLRSNIGIVSQRIFLFKGTVLENILYGQNEKNRQDVEDIIKELKLQRYISELAKGLDTEIIQNSGVSGGQIQVIAFIRAMLSRKAVIILDEPISNVDVETSNTILEILKKREFEGILILISHSTDKMDFVNRIIDMDNQSIKSFNVNSGTEQNTFK